MSDNPIRAHFLAHPELVEGPEPVEGVRAIGRKVACPPLILSLSKDDDA